MGIGLSYLNHMMEQQAAQDRKDEAFRADPSKLDSLVASVAAKISPSGQKPKMSDFQSKTEAYDSLVKPDHPFAGFGNEMKERMSAILAHPASKGVSPVELADALSSKMLNEPGKSGVSRIAEANEFKRRQDARWFGIPGEDTSLRKPLGSQYDTWLAERRKQETPEGMAAIYRSQGNEEKAREVLADASGAATPGGLALNIGAGAAVGAAFGGGLPGAAIGAVTGGISEILGKPISKAVSRSEWYNSIAGPLTASRSETTAGDIAKVAIPAGIVGLLKGGGVGVKGLVTGAVSAAVAGAGITDTGKAFLAEVAPYVAVGGALDKVAFKAFLVPKAAGKAIAANPSAKNVVDAGDAIESSTKIMSDESFVGRIVNKIVNAGDMKLGVNEDFIKELKSFTPGGKRSAILGKAVEDHLLGADARWKAMQEGEVTFKFGEAAGTKGNISPIKPGKFIPDLDGATTEEYAAWANKVVNQFDSIAHEEAGRHPQGYAFGVEEAAARMRSRQLVENEIIEPTVNFLDDQRKSHRVAMTAKKANALVEQKLQMQNAKLNKAVKAPEEVVNRVLRETSFDPNLERAMPEAGSTVPRTAPQRLVDSITKIDADPKISEAIRVTSAPTELGNIAAIPELSVSAPARKLSAKLQKAKEARLAYQEQKMLEKMSPDERADYLAEKAWDSPEMQQRRFELSARNEIKNSPEYKAQQAADEAELKAYNTDRSEPVWNESTKTWESSEGRTKVKNTAKEGLEKASEDDLAGRGELSVATEKEAAAKPVDVIRRVKGKTPRVDAAVVRTETTALEEAAAKRTKDIQSLSPEEAFNKITRIHEEYKGGTKTAEKAADEINEIADVYTNPDVLDKNFAGSDEGVGNWLGMSDGIVRELRNAITNKAVIALAGAGVASFFLGGKEAEAGGFSEALVKGLSTAKDLPKAAIEFMEAAKAARYFVPTVEAGSQFLIPLEGFQRGIKGGAAAILDNFPTWAAKAPEKSFRLSHMSPDKVLDEITNTGKGLMNNVAPFKASYQGAEYANIVNGTQVVKNIVTDAGIVSARNEVKEAFKPLNKLMERQIEFDWRTEEINYLTKELERIAANSKKHPDDVVASLTNETEKSIADHTEKLKGLQNVVKEFHGAWEPVAEQAAREHSAVRTFLALGDNAEFEKYPFLKNIPFTTDEKVAIGRTREQLLQYKERLKEVGADTIEGPYAHHVLHPDLDTKQFTNMMGGREKAAAYLKVYRRSFNSRPLMPDLEMSMERYVMDTERRIQQKTFWEKEGWNAVLDRSEGYPVIHDALKALKYNVAPIDNTNINKLLQKYQEFEAVMRLFLSPSATLKHLIKETGDLAQRGFGETVEAYPLAAKMTGIRIAETDPMVRKSLTKLGFTSKNDQDRLLQEYFKGIVPAQGMRTRLLDIGLTQQDDLFKKAGGLWGKIQDVGSMGINFAELSGRGLSTVLGMLMASKKGMTIEQGLYGTYDMILKNNFLSREFNPAWLQHPGIKAAFMFQGTPFKIMERRVVNFMRSGRVVKDVGEAIYNATKLDYKNGNFAESSKILKQFRDIRSLVKEGEHRVTSNIFLDAALKETDFFGTPVINQMAKDIFIVGAATYGGAEVGVNLYHHFFHIPFMKAMTTGSEPVLAANPGIAAIYKGIDAWKKRDENDDEWVTTKILNKWLGGGFYGLIPDPIKKLHRISIDDIPDIYKKDPYKYLFAIPATKGK